jgi:hypothetical protein
MSRKVFVRFSYFGYSAEFMTPATSTAERRSQANEIVLAKFGQSPAIRYVEPGLPFPEYVPMHVWDEQDKAWYSV